MTLLQNILLNGLSAALTVYSFFLFYSAIAPQKNQKTNYIIMLDANNSTIYPHIDIC